MSTFRVPRRVGVIEGLGEDDALYLAGLPDGPIVVLRDTALTIWQEAVSSAGDRDLAEQVADVYGLAVDEVREAVETCVADLVGKGVLEAANGAANGPANGA